MSRNQMWPFSELSLETATRWSAIANAALVVSLVVGVIATYAIVRLGNVKERHWDVARQESNERIHTLQVQLEEARGSIAIANNAAAQAQLELAKLKAAQAPWEFSAEQRAAFSTSLQGQPRGKILIMYTSADGTRGSDFADALNRVLKTELGFDVWGYIGPFTSAGPSPLVGIELTMTDDPSRPLRDALASAFQHIGIDAKLTRGSGMSTEAGQVVIAIGIKPPNK